MNGMDLRVVYNNMKKLKNFDIQNKLGSGSYGVIYKALNKLTKEVVVLKQISMGRLSEKAKKSAVNEATIMGKLVHPFIVSYRESFIEDNVLNIVMEYCNNGDLSQFLKLQNKRPLKEDKIWRFFIEICIGLEYIHKNKILHRDIKTLNIFMNKNEEIKIGDLGVAKMLTSNEFAQTMVGTPFYLSPQLCEEKPYNQKSDIWAMGCLLYELCTFKHPFEAHNQASLILKIVRGKYSPIPEFYSKDLKDTIDLCLERDYKRRPNTSNLLARPKIRQKIEELGISKLVEEQIKKLNKDKQMSVAPKVTKQDKPAVSNKERLVKATPIPTSTPDIKKVVVKAVDSEPRNDIIKRQEPKKWVINKEETPRKEEILKKNEVKREPVIIYPKQINYSEKRLAAVDVKKENEVKENKNDFVANLNRMMEEDQKQKKVNKSANKPVNVYPQTPIKPSDIKKEERVQKVAEKIVQIKANKEKHIELVKSPSLQEQKRDTPSIHNKKSSNSNDVRNIKKEEVVKQPSFLRPPMPPSSQLGHKQPIMKVKNQKVIQAKVYDSQKNIYKPSGIIKSGGFTANVEPERVEKIEKKEYHSRDKLHSAKRASNPDVKVIEKQKQPPKQLFGLPPPLPTPTAQHKSEKQIKPPGYAALHEQKRRQESSKISRVRKGGPSQFARNAKNVSHRDISKQEEDLVMNLPTKLKNDGGESSDSDEGVSQEQIQVAQDLKRKSVQKGFHLKQINNDLVLQKYEDMMNSANESTEREEREEEDSVEFEFKDSLDERGEQAFVRPKGQVKALDIDVNDNNEDRIEEEDKIVENLEYGRRNSNNSNEPIEEHLESQLLAQEEGDQQQQYKGEANNSDSLEDEQEEQDEKLEEQDEQDEQDNEWSFDEEPELPMLEDKQSPYFQPHNPYLIQEQEETTENKINHLQAKLSQNMKREDELNKLMQIKLDECRKFIGIEKSLKQILQFFRVKLHMEDDYSENDEKEVQLFLKRHKLTDHSKFQNIYKIMHFQMQLENTRKIIQRICKKLSEMEQGA